MRLVGAIVLAICLSVLFSQSALAEKRVALVIGNSSYQNVARLANPANDAQLVAETLKAAGFDPIISLHDLKTTEMRRALRAFADQMRDADVAVVFYAGHGIEVDGINYLIPIDAVLERDIDVYDEAFSLDRILVTVDPARRLRLIILDACRDNPFAKTMKRTIATRAVGRGLARVEPASPNTLIAFAAKAGSTASDGDEKNSPFTTALVKHIATPGLDLRKAFGYVRDDVLKATGNRQEPYVYGSLGGDDVALVPAKAVAAGPQTDPQDVVRKDYELALQVGTRDAWDAFLAQYPEGFYANLARAQLNRIAAEEARAAATEKAQLAEQEKARLAAEGARNAEQEKAAAAAKVAEEARIAAESAKQIAQAKAEAAEQARKAAENALANRIAAEKAEAERRTAEQATADKLAAKKTAAEKKTDEKLEAPKTAATKVVDNAIAENGAAEQATEKVASEKSAVEARPAETASAPGQAASATLKQDAPNKLAALAPEPTTQNGSLSTSEIVRLVEGELRRVGCFVGDVSDQWDDAARRSLERFNKYSDKKLQGRTASLDILDALKAKTTRVCPLLCNRGYRPEGNTCIKIDCKAGYRLANNNACERIEVKKQATKPYAPVTSSEKSGRRKALPSNEGAALHAQIDRSALPPAAAANTSGDMPQIGHMRRALGRKNCKMTGHCSY